MHIMRALVGVHGLEIHHMADHMILVGDAVAAMHVAGEAGDLQRLAAVVALHQGDDLRRRLAGVDQAPEPQRALQAQRDLGLHVRQFFLNQLGGGERTPELLALQRVLTGGMPAKLGGPHRPPGDAVAGAVQATEGAA